MRGHRPILIFLALLPGAAAAQVPLPAASGAPARLTLSGEVRLRGEAMDGQYRALGAASDALLSVQTRLFAGYDLGGVRLGAELWDARAYGQSAASTAGTGEVNALELVQAHVAVDLDRRTTVQAGRFTMDLGSRRLVARNLFRNSTNAFTGIRLDHRGGGGAQLVLFWTMPQLRLPRTPEAVRANRVAWDRESLDLQLAGASLTLPAGPASLQLYALGLVEHDAPDFPTADRRLLTLGLRHARPPAAGHWDHDVEIAHQQGSARTAIIAGAPRVDVAAWLVHAEAGRRLAVPWQPRLALLFDLASGGSGPDGIGRFDTLYGARRFEFGPSGLFGALARANIVAAGVRVEAQPSPRVDLMAMWRPAWAAADGDGFAQSGVRPTAASGRFAGHMAEARLRWWAVPGRVRLDTGAALLAKGRLLREGFGARATGDTVYGYLDLGFSL